MTVKFQQRHYEAIAKLLDKEIKADLDAKGFARVVARFADMFERDNPAFQSKRFMAACYPELVQK